MLINYIFLYIYITWNVICVTRIIVLPNIRGVRLIYIFNAFILIFTHNIL